MPDIPMGEIVIHFERDPELKKKCTWTLGQDGRIIIKCINGHTARLGLLSVTPDGESIARVDCPGMDTGECNFAFKIQFEDWEGV